MGWESIGLIQPQSYWTSFPIPVAASPDILQIDFQIHGSSLRIYSRLLIRQIHFVDGELLRSRPFRVFPDLNEQIITFPQPSQGTPLYIEIKKYWRSWRWRTVPEPAFLVQLSCLLP